MTSKVDLGQARREAPTAGAEIAAAGQLTVDAQNVSAGGGTLMAHPFTLALPLINGAAFENLGVNAERLFARIARTPDGLFR